MIKQHINMLLIALIVVAGGIAVAVNIYYKSQLQQQPSTAGTGAASDNSMQTALVGQRRPDFTLPDDIGLPHELSEWDGKIIVLNFWATWCRPCQHEIPMLSQLHDRFQGRGVTVLGVAIDDRQAVRTFLERTAIKLSYPLLVGDDAAIPVAKAYGNEFGILPFTVVIDRDGVIRFSQFGEISRDLVEGWLGQILVADTADAA